MKGQINIEERLLHDVLTNETTENLRRASLARGLGVLGRRRRNRKLAQVCLVALLLGAPVALLVKRADRASPISGRNAGDSVAHSQTVPSLPAGFEQINDRELLALFPNHTVALVGGPGQQRLLVLDKDQSRHSVVQ